ncbi:extracellular solute-binding protein, partial [Celeribacter marinus]|uniref:extracellular solute-binding protein n=1 Tax=Celeribacter marinus TaxID=1397108 RepID=UPI003F6B218A
MITGSSQLLHLPIGSRAISGQFDSITFKHTVAPNDWSFHMAAAHFPLALFTAASIVVSSGAAHSQDTSTIVATWFSDWDEAKYSTPVDHLDYVNPDAPKGGKIVLGTVGDFDSLNPYSTRSGTPAANSSIPYERLMTGVSDEALSASYCLLCETIEYPESQDWVIFNLRRDVTFSDGTPMTSADVVFTHEKFMAEGTLSWRTGVGNMIAGVEALDDYTVRFEFQPNAPRNGLISQAGSTLVMQKAWFDETGAKIDEKRFDVSPGTGAYAHGAFEAGQWVEYTRNPDYWGRDLWLKKGTENFDTIRIEYFGDTIAAFEAFKSGEITFRQENSSLNWATGYDFPALESGAVIKAELPDGSLPNATGLVFNLRQEKLQDRNVRRALGLMYNFTWTNETLQYGLFEQRESFWDTDALKAVGVAQGKELSYLEAVRGLVPDEVFTQEAALPHESGARSLDRKNMRQALMLMEAAGYTPGSDGKLRDANDQVLKIEILENTPSFDRILIPYVENLVALGVDAVYSRVDTNAYQARTQSFDYDIIFGGYTSGFEEGVGLAQKYGSEGVDDVFNPAGYASEAADILIAQVVEAETYEEMSAALKAVDRLFRYDYFVVPTWYLDKHWVAYY